MSPNWLTIGHSDASPASCVSLPTFVELLLTLLLVPLDVSIAEVVEERSERSHLIDGTRPRRQAWKEGHPQIFVLNRRTVRRVTN